MLPGLPLPDDRLRETDCANAAGLKMRTKRARMNWFVRDKVSDHPE